MEIILKYFKGLSDYQIKQLQVIGEIYQHWNQKINIISRKDIDHLYLKHVLHSLSIARYIWFIPGTQILDVGTGGGFPGIPLAILFPEIEFVLVDSVAKKIKVVQSVCNRIGLKNTKAFQSRAEDITGSYDFVISRAVAPIPKLLEWTSSKISKNSRNSFPNGILALKGGDLSCEMKISNQVNVVDLSTYFEESFFKTKKLIHVFV
jgi:16S rRNA (guanine527-N7)-methyltransferase